MKCDICQHPDQDSYEHWVLQCVDTPPPAWTTKDGRTIPVPDLDDDYLKNIFKMIRDKARFNFSIFLEMVDRGFWDADRGILSRRAFQLLGYPSTVNGTVIEFREICDHEGACKCWKNRDA